MPWALCECQYCLGLSSFIPTPFLPLLCRILLPRVLGKVCLLQREACVDFWACITLHGTGIAQTRVSVLVAHWEPIPTIPFPFHGPTGHVAHWEPIPTIPFPFHGPTGHVDPLGLLPFSLGFPSPLSSSFLLILPMGLLAVIPVTLAHWACYLFSWASLTHYFHL